MSIIGRPNMDDELELCDDEPADTKHHVIAPTSDDADPDDDEDDDWGELTIKEMPKEEVIPRGGKRTGSMQFFVPEPVLSLVGDTKPPMPLLTSAELPPGTLVWVVDEDDVKLLLKDNWDAAVRVVCNGRERGTVVRHSGADCTVVLFENGAVGLKYSFTLPRACLSKVPIASYDSSPKMSGTKTAAFSPAIGGVGKLGPGTGRGTAKTKEEVNILQQYYEVMSVNGVVCPSCDGCMELLRKGKLQEALAEIERLIHDDVVTEFRKEQYSIRSTIQLFLGNYSAALSDALKVIEINPSWVKGYLRAARAYQALGKFTLASHMINQSLLLLPHSTEVSHLCVMNDFLRRQQSDLESQNNVMFRLDSKYAKRLVSKRGFQPGETIVSETEHVVCKPAMHNEASCCWACLSANNLSEEPAPLAKHVVTGVYCSKSCHQRSSLFLPMEMERHALGHKSAELLIQSKAATSLNALPLEYARLTIRLFFVVISTHERLLQGKQQQHPSTGDSGDETVTVDDTLRHLGVYPLVSSELDHKAREELTVLCQVLCQRFTDDEKRVYPTQLFLSLFDYVASYGVLTVTPTEEPQQQHPPARRAPPVVKGYVLPSWCGAVNREAAAPNCEVRASSSGVLELVARSEIFRDTYLSVAPPKMHAE